jgi:hypothetical protein
LEMLLEPLFLLKGRSIRSSQINLSREVSSIEKVVQSVLKRKGVQSQRTPDETFKYQTIDRTGETLMAHTHWWLALPAVARRHELVARWRSGEVEVLRTRGAVWRARSWPEWVTTGLRRVVGSGTVKFQAKSLVLDGVDSGDDITHGCCLPS